MAKFMYVFRGGAFVHPGVTPAEIGAHLQRWTVWLGELAKAGYIESPGLPLQDGGRTIQGRNKAVTDGPYAEAKDLVTGSQVVIAKSLEEATEVAMGCPIYLYDGSVEVRTIRGVEG